MPLNNNIKFKTKKTKKQTKKKIPLSFVLLLIAEIFLGLVALLNILPLSLFVIVHFIIVSLIFLILLKPREDDLTQLVLGLIVTMIAGPLGAFSFLVFLFFKRFSKPSSQNLLDDWYYRLSSSVEQSHETQKFQHIHNGRAAGLGHLSVQNFEKVMSGKDLHDKQTLLGILALKYRPEYLPILKNALADKEPTIRVQAAAAYTKLRTHFKNILKENTKPTTIDMTNLEAQNHFTQKILALSSCIKSGLLDEGETKDIKAYLGMLHIKAKENNIPNSLHTDLVFSSLLQEQGKYEESCLLLKSYLSTGDKEVQKHYTQCLLALKRFDQLSSLQTINP